MLIDFFQHMLNAEHKLIMLFFYHRHGHSS